MNLLLTNCGALSSFPEQLHTAQRDYFGNFPLTQKHKRSAMILKRVFCLIKQFAKGKFSSFHFHSS